MATKFLIFLLFITPLMESKEKYYYPPYYPPYYPAYRPPYYGPAYGPAYGPQNYYYSYRPQHTWYPGYAWTPGWVYYVPPRYFYEVVNEGVYFTYFYYPRVRACKPVHKVIKKAAEKCKVAEDVSFIEVDCEKAGDKCKKYTKSNKMEVGPRIVWIENGVRNGTFKGPFNLGAIEEFFWKKHNESDITNPKNSEPPSVEIALPVYLAVFGLYFISYVTMYLD